MHETITRYMPELVVPNFEIFDEKENEFKFNYKSTRTGLSSMVIDLITGLGKKFKTPCVINLIESNAIENGAFDRFEVSRYKLIGFSCAYF